MLQLKSYPSFSFAAKPLYESGIWTCHILSLDVCEGYYRVTLDTTDDVITFLCGNGGYHWIFFPELGLGTILGNFHDVEYNSYKLGEIYSDFNSISIIYCLINIDDFINNTLKKEGLA